MNRLAILGASGHGKIVADAAKLCGWKEVFFFDDSWPTLKKNSHWDVIGDSNALFKNISSFDGAIVAIGDNATRMGKSISLIDIGANLVSIIHPSATISPFAKIGIGSFIGAGAVVQVDVTIGRYNIINTNAVIEHDCKTGDAVHVSPSASLAGGVAISKLCWIGIGANVRQLINIGPNTIVGAGSVVIKNIEDNQIVVGNPAKPIYKG